MSMPESVATMFGFAWVQNVISDIKRKYNLKEEEMLVYGECYTDLITLNGSHVRFVKWDDFNYVVHLKHIELGLDYSTYPWHVKVPNKHQEKLLKWKKNLESQNVTVRFREDHLLCSIDGNLCYQIDNEDEYYNFLMEYYEPCL